MAGDYHQHHHHQHHHHHHHHLHHHYLKVAGAKNNHSIMIMNSDKVDDHDGGEVNVDVTEPIKSWQMKINKNMLQSK